jgi:hypothetical protein
MVAKIKYTPIGDAISPEATIVQAAIALDVAAQWAVESRNIEQMNNVALGWTELSKVLMSIDEDESTPPVDKEPVGFRKIEAKEEEDVRIDRPTDDESPSEGEPGVHEEHGKLRISKARYRS